MNRDVTQIEMMFLPETGGWSAPSLFTVEARQMLRSAIGTEVVIVALTPTQSLILAAEPTGEPNLVAIELAGMYGVDTTGFLGNAALVGSYSQEVPVSLNPTLIRRTKEIADRITAMAAKRARAHALASEIEAGVDSTEEYPAEHDGEQADEF
ncbi:MAG: hypothetical protein WKF57_03830 [Nakamurella sp.]